MIFAIIYLKTKTIQIKKYTLKKHIILMWKPICMILDLHSSAAEDSSLLGCDITLDEKLPVFWMITVPSWSRSSSQRRIL